MTHSLQPKYSGAYFLYARACVFFSGSLGESSKFVADDVNQRKMDVT